MQYKNIICLTVLTWTTMLILGVTCTEKGAFENEKTLKQLYETYKDGQISECKYNGKRVYSACLNAYDAGSVIYDKDGKQIGRCNYAWGKEVDSICKQLTDNEVIYRVKDNIWGLPAVDKYGLGGDNSLRTSPLPPFEGGMRTSVIARSVATKQSACAKRLLHIRSQ